MDATELGCAHQPLSVDASAGWARIQGVFGCFQEGRAEIECLDEAGEVQRRIDLGPASPLRALAVDGLARLDAGTRLMRLSLFAEDGSYIGALASHVLQI